MQPTCCASNGITMLRPDKERRRGMNRTEEDARNGTKLNPTIPTRKTEWAQPDSGRIAPSARPARLRDAFRPHARAARTRRRSRRKSG